MNRRNFVQCVGCILIFSFFSHAELYRFEFDPNHLIETFTAGDDASYRPDQADPRLVYQKNPLDLTRAAATFTDHPSRGSRWSGDDAYYQDWLTGLGAGEGIRAFNIWITPADYLASYGNPYTREDILQQMYSRSNDISAWSGTAGGDWTAKVSMIYSNATDGPSYGIYWSTTNPAACLRPGGVDLGTFSFTLSDVAVNGSGDSPEEGQAYNFWFGSYSLIFDDQGWGNTSTGAVFSSSVVNDAGWEAGTALVAQVVPEPSSALLLGLSAMSLFVRRMSRRWLE